MNAARPPDPNTASLAAIALDDERPALEVIDAFAGGVAALDLRATFTSIDAARAYLSEQPVDLVFLDVDMPAASGLEVARELPEATQVIFTTAYAQFAAESYELSATDYLVKPFTPSRFERAVARALERRSARRALAAGGGPAAVPEPIDFRVDYGVQRVDPRDVTYAEALDNYVRIHREGENRPLTVRMTMRELGDVLGAATGEAEPRDAFARIHRSYLVRIGAVAGVRGRQVRVDGAELPLGATYREAFREAFARAGGAG